MKYVSTRSDIVPITAAQTIVKGICGDGGLYVPEVFPQLSAEQCMGKTYNETAAIILSLYLTDYSAEDIKHCINSAYTKTAFNDKLANVEKINNKLYALELWHGPTCAFKDYALQLMPYLFTSAKKLLHNDKLTKILVATSGDTGKAALEGYKNIDGIKLAVFYPNDGTSEVQRLQMATQEGDNVQVYAVDGNFDDAQKGVKSAFLDNDLAKKLSCKGAELSSANSINWGRLLPQIVYYYYSYCKLVSDKEIENGETIDYCVPTGNFGDILAGYYAKQMGLPIGKLICASNKNNVLFDFIRTGTYNAKRDFYKTSSPSMDILVSSNLERLLYHLLKDKALVKSYMESLSVNGKYEITQQLSDEINKSFGCDYANDDDVAEEIAYEYNTNNYLCDTHTAVAFIAARHAQAEGGNKCVVVSTASPFKFSGAVLKALGKAEADDEFETMRLLEAITGKSAPTSLLALQGKPIRFTDTISAADISIAADKL